MKYLSRPSRQHLKRFSLVAFLLVLFVIQVFSVAWASDDSTSKQVYDPEHFYERFLTAVKEIAKRKNQALWISPRQDYNESISAFRPTLSNLRFNFFETSM